MAARCCYRRALVLGVELPATKACGGALVALLLLPQPVHLRPFRLGDQLSPVQISGAALAQVRVPGALIEHCDPGLCESLLDARIGQYGEIDGHCRGSAGRDHAAGGHT